MKIKEPPIPTGHRVICHVCGVARDAVADFAKAQLKKKSPRCRSCAPNKFSNQGTGGSASKKEHRSVVNYRAAAAAGAITELREQVVFELIPAQRDERGKLLERACTYIADVVYRDDRKLLHVVDIKGFRTDVYRLKRKLMLFVHGIRIEEE